MGELNRAIHVKQWPQPPSHLLLADVCESQPGPEESQDTAWLWERCAAIQTSKRYQTTLSMQKLEYFHSRLWQCKPE